MTIWATRESLIRNMNYLPFAQTWVQSRYFDGVLLLIFLVFCVPFFFCLRPVYCGTMLPVSLDCQFSIARSVISNVNLPHTILSSSSYHGKKSNSQFYWRVALIALVDVRPILLIETISSTIKHQVITLIIHIIYFY